MRLIQIGAAVAALLAGLLASTPAVAQGNKKLMSVNAAKADARRGLLESVVGLKVKSESVVRDMVAERYTIDAKTSGAIRDIEFVDMVYDPEKDIAKVIARVKVSQVKNVVGLKIDYADATIERTGFGTSTPENAPALQALRAAQVDAYQKLAEELVGLRIDSKTRVENFVLQSDEIKTGVLAALWGAEVRAFSWDSAGDAYVSLALRANYLKDILGNRFTGEQPEIVVEGSGAATDTFSSVQTSGPGGDAAVREAPLGVPGPTTGAASAAP